MNIQFYGCRMVTQNRVSQIAESAGSRRTVLLCSRLYNMFRQMSIPFFNFFYFIPACFFLFTENSQQFIMFIVKYKTL